MLFSTFPEASVGATLLGATGVLAEAGIKNARFEAMLLMMFALSMRREQIILENNRPLTARERLIFDKALSLRAERRPLAYITGERWFYGRPFKINRAVLIPRPETEMLVDFAIEKSDKLDSKQIADIGTGSGCIAVSIALELPNAGVTAVDLSRLALLLAMKNVKRHHVENRVTLLEGDLLDPLVGKKFDMIISNPPYIPPSDLPGLMPEVANYEPELALWKGAGEDGMMLHRRLLDGGRSLLSGGGWIAMEVGTGQADSICSFAEEYGYKRIQARPDLGGIERVVAAQWL
jgi:release factor glutamine methyltransferase